jgi:hypothetical protein
MNIVSPLDANGGKAIDGPRRKMNFAIRGQLGIEQARIRVHNHPSEFLGSSLSKRWVG